MSYLPVIVKIYILKILLVAVYKIFSLFGKKKEKNKGKNLIVKCVIQECLSVCKHETIARFRERLNAKCSVS